MSWQWRRPLAASFWERVQKSPDVAGCWTWTGTKTRQGYGILHTATENRKTVLAHRVSWLLNKGPIVGSLYVLHHCDNPPCVRPDHLFLGTHTDNVEDARVKGRFVGKQFPFPVKRGVAVNTAKLNEELVRQIRVEARVNGGTKSMRQLARDYHVTLPTIRGALHRKTWRHVA